MTRLLATCFVLALLLAACKPDPGERCNPLLFEDECTGGTTCVYPTAPTCGVAYCCALDAQGNITDTHPGCQPDPASAAQCMIDLGTAD